MYKFSKGFFVAELKKVGINKYEDRWLESYKTHVLARLYQIHVVEKKNK